LTRSDSKSKPIDLATPPTRATATAKQVPFHVAGGGGDDSGPAVAVGGMPVDPDSDSDKEHPLQEPQFVFHAVDDDERRQRWPGLLPIHHRRPRALADEEREKRLDFSMALFGSMG